MKDSVARFSNRVENYARYRPGYPPEMLAFFRSELKLNADSAIADVGSGTGISSSMFLENGNRVYGIEPNDAMRAAAEDYLRNFASFISVDGTAEQTTLANDSADFVIAAQAFHWFDPERTRTEFRRILKPEGYITLIWNERQLDTTDFLRDYEKLLLKWSNDYERVRHENIDEERLSQFFQADFRGANFANSQTFDFEGLAGRVQSASYMPAAGDKKFQPMLAELRDVFDKHSEQAKIKILYDTRVFFTQV
ncbi:MAG: class I SAM-dependent methyltransferase [Acidobacteria bacterium]|nr:class I SAM-dependent methyltransferase [Acidobacteriota bacterium]MCA1607839.1 class I SAM-dependent methyltransferase [Acidobacteriota bacterium]